MLPSWRNVNYVPVWPERKHHERANNEGMPLLDDVAEAGKRAREAREEWQQAREELRAKIRTARDEGIPFAVIARAAGISREWTRRLYAGR
jgi:hypothetical protein